MGTPMTLVPPPAPLPARRAERDQTLRDLVGYAIPELFWGFGWALSIDHPLPAAFLDQFQGPAVLVGAFAFLSGLLVGVGSLVSTARSPAIRSKRDYVLWGHVLPGGIVLLLGLLMLALPTLAVAGVQTLWLLLFTCFFLALGALVPVWMSYIGDLFPAGMHARVLGITFACNRLGAIGGGTLSEHFLAGGGGPQTVWGTMFLISGACLVLGSAGYLLVQDKRHRAEPRLPVRAHLRRMLATWRELPRLRRFVRADLLGVSAMVLVVFYGDLGIRKLGFADAWAGDWTRSMAAAQFTGAALIALLGHRVAPRTWLITSLLVAVAGCALSLVVERPEHLRLVAAASGIWLVVRMSCHGPEVMRLTAGRDSTVPVALAWFLAAPFMGGLPLVAGALIPTMGYEHVFGFVAAGCAISALLLFFGRGPVDGKPVVTRISEDVG